MNGKRLKYQRLKKGYFLMQLSEISGLSQARLNDFEKGNAQPDDDTIEKLSEALEIDTWEFFRYINDALKFTHNPFCADIKLSQIKQ